MDSIPMQRYCPVCGRTDLPMENHHVIHRSQGGEDGPTIPLCKQCHADHHDRGIIDFEYSDDRWWWFSTRDPDKWLLLLDVWDEGKDAIPFEDEDDEAFREALQLVATADYLLSQEVIRKNQEFRDDRKAFAEWLAVEHDFTERSAGSWITKRIAYGKLPPEAADLGITKGYIVATLVAEGHDLSQVMSDIHSMPRSQFNETYGLSTKPKPKCSCPDCGATHNKKKA